MPISVCLFLLHFCIYIMTWPPGNKIFKRMLALEGTWKMNTRKGSICEEWKRINNTYLQSRGYMIRGSDTTINERVALRNDKEGIHYISTVENQNQKQPVIFTMTSAIDNAFVFENPHHDFPKRIVYQFVTRDSLHAWIDDGIDGSKQRLDFYYSKTLK